MFGVAESDRAAHGVTALSASLHRVKEFVSRGGLWFWSEQRQSVGSVFMPRCNEVAWP